MKKNRLLRKSTSLFAALIAIFAVSCADDFAEPPILLAPGEAEHTMIMYMFAHNDLTGSMLQNILAAEQGVKKSLPSGRLVVYLDRADSTYLYQMQYLPYGNGSEHIRHWQLLKGYSKQDSHDPKVMRSVMADIRQLAPSKNYGLVVSGHGTGWFPRNNEGTSYNEQRIGAKGTIAGGNSQLVAGTCSTIANEYHFPTLLGEESMTKYIGCDNYDINDSMVASELIEGLQDMHFEYIIFDACFMGSVEFIYEIRDVADYVISSPVEVLKAGYPYSDLVPLLLGANQNLVDVSAKIVDVYKNTFFSSLKSVAISLVDCSQLDDLADVMAKVYAAAKKNYSGDCVSVIEQVVDKTRLQPLDRVTPTAFYDFEDFAIELCDDNVQLQTEVEEVIAKTILYAENTEDIWSASSMGDYWNIEYKVDGVLDMCGLSVYMPIKSAPITMSFYSETAWARKVYGL